MNEYQFVRARTSIYGDSGTKKPTSYTRECTRLYTPDFPGRHKETGKAFLVEIKSQASVDDPKLALRKEVAGNYTPRKSYDWIYKVIFDGKIIFPAE